MFISLNIAGVIAGLYPLVNDESNDGDGDNKDGHQNGSGNVRARKG